MAGLNLPSNVKSYSMMKKYCPILFSLSRQMKNKLSKELRISTQISKKERIGMKKQLSGDIKLMENKLKKEVRNHLWMEKPTSKAFHSIIAIKLNSFSLWNG